jgi:L-rhamnose isomerase
LSRRKTENRRTILYIGGQMLHRGRNAVTQYERARSEYADLGVDVESVLDALAEIPVSIHCWQGDDVGGFERPDSVLAGGGIQATGNFPERLGTWRNCGRIWTRSSRLFREPIG